MAKTLLGEIAHQIFYTPPKRKPKYKNRNKEYERAMYKIKQAAFENKKAYEINKLILKSKGLI